MSEKTPVLATKSRPLGKPGGPGLFHDKNLDLPPYVQNIAHSLMAKRGLPKSRAIQLALGAVERWKNGGDDVSPEVRAAAAKAWAQWEAAKAKARATPNKSSKHANDARAISLSWDPSEHPRAAAGAAGGGQFVSPGAARDQAAGEAQKDERAKDLYRLMLAGKVDVKKLNDADLQKLSRILYSFKTSDERVVKARVTTAGELSRRGMDVKKFGALGGGSKSSTSKAPAKPKGNVDDPKLLDHLLSRLSPDERSGLARELLLTAARLSGVIDLAGPVQHWKHDWKPITPYAVAVKAKQLRGSTKGKPAAVPKSVKAKAAAQKPVRRAEEPSPSKPKPDATREAMVSEAKRLGQAAVDHMATMKTNPGSIRKGTPAQRRKLDDLVGKASHVAAQLKKRDKDPEAYDRRREQEAKAAQYAKDRNDPEAATKGPIVRRTPLRLNGEIVGEVATRNKPVGNRGNVKPVYELQIPGRKPQEFKTKDEAIGAAKVQAKKAKADDAKPTTPKPSAKTAERQKAEFDALSQREQRAYSQAYSPGVQGNHAAGMKAVEHFRSTEEGRSDQRSSLNIEEHRAYRQAAKDIRDPAAAHKAGMAAVAPLKRKRDEERVAKEAQRKAAQERADVDLRKRMADSKAKASEMGLDLDPSRPQQQLVRQNGKTIGVLEARVKDSSRKEGSRPAGIDEEPDMYVSRVSGSHTAKVGGGETSVVRKQHASVGEALAHVKQHHTTDSKRAQKDLQGGLFEAPKASKAPRSSKAPSLGEGEVGGPIKFAGGRTGTVWAEAPKGGKWVIPDDRKAGEAHAIYVDSHGDVHTAMSSAVYQKDWLRARKQEVDKSAPNARKAEAERSKKLADKVEQIRGMGVSKGRPFKSFTDDELAEMERRHGNRSASKEPVRGGRTIADLVKDERERRRGEAVKG